MTSDATGRKRFVFSNVNSNEEQTNKLQYE